MWGYLDVEHIDAPCSMGCGLYELHGYMDVDHIDAGYTDFRRVDPFEPLACQLNNSTVPF